MTVTKSNLIATTSLVSMRTDLSAGTGLREAFMIARELSLLPLSGVRAAHHSLAQQ
jgi:hypothetical protein